VGRRSRIQAIVVDVRGRGTPVSVIDIKDALQVEPSTVLRALQDLYGPSPVDADPRTAAMSPEAARLAQSRVKWSAKPYPRTIRVLDVLCPVLAVTAAALWPRAWYVMVHAEPWTSILLLMAVCGIGAYMVPWAFGLMLGGAPRELVIDNEGVTIRRRWRDSRIAADRILGVQQRTYVDPRRGRAVSYARVVVARDGRAWTLKERAFRSEQEGLIAGVLLHRFGEFLPPNTSGRAAV
jgi:hypothetical protein